MAGKRWKEKHAFRYAIYRRQTNQPINKFMANTYTQIYMHIVFAVSHRQSLISETWESELYAYLAGACKKRHHFVLAINGTADHVHILLSMHPSESVSSLVKELKGQSSKWINEKYLNGMFRWQSGFGAFSYSRSFIPTVKAYILNQKEHHKKETLQEEMLEIYRKAGIEYNSDYVMRGYIEKE